MPKLIDYPRTSYTGAWELAEIVDDTGGKCAIDTAARKLNRKVSGSFKAIIGSAVKFGLMTSKRELLSTTTLFRRIKHAYDKAEELQFHREAFLTPPLFTQLCRKFRNRELPVQMLDVMLIREFGVEEINAQNVAKAFVDGCRMCGLMDERNIVADIDAFSAARVPRRELASSPPTIQAFNLNTPGAGILTDTEPAAKEATDSTEYKPNDSPIGLFAKPSSSFVQAGQPAEGQLRRADAIANLFGLNEATNAHETVQQEPTAQTQQPAFVESQTRSIPTPEPVPTSSGPHTNTQPTASPIPTISGIAAVPPSGYQMQMSGPGVNTVLDISDEDDLAIAIAMLEKIRRQLRANTQ
ncbi:hypothetical protein MON38_08895 [Hymenobacter sp. DH14]|uniref:Uncharacterized protein n=1 Tax=Hymenobacter cyanobacteriorum TaxID=2926463 RepID=A0A9X1VIE2_9BACT|nr:hypothetical protein [Hymenobacter cyanobacteriorum]MCI1187535.1 hypothetical protein [Hymenobacter cyanobacteriorum]